MRYDTWTLCARLVLADDLSTRRIAITLGISLGIAIERFYAVLATRKW